MDEKTKAEIESKLVQLAVVKKAAGEALDRKDALLKSVLNSAEYLKAQLDYQNSILEVDRLTVGVKTMALAIYAVDQNKTIYPQVKIRSSKPVITLEYEEPFAFEWAKKEAPALITLDRASFEKYAQGVADTPMALPWVKIKETVTNTATVSEDLSAWLPKEPESDLPF